MSQPGLESNYSVSGELLQKILNYIVTKPYSESYLLVKAIQDLKPTTPSSEDSHASRK